MSKTTQNIYSYPLDMKFVTKIVKDNPSHIGPYHGSIDFAAPIGTTVCAAYDGVISRVRDDSELDG